MGALVYQEEDFQPNEIEIGWDGYDNGKRAPSGVYIYVLETVYINGRTEIITGDITLLR